MFPIKRKTVFDISWGSLAKIGVALALGWGVYLSRDVLVMAFSGLIISALFNPAVDFLERAKISRPVAVFLVYFSIFGSLGAGIYLVAPFFIAETQQLGQLFPMYFNWRPFLSGLGFAVFGSMDAPVAAVRDWLVSVLLSRFGRRVFDGNYNGHRDHRGGFFSLENGALKMYRDAGGEKHENCA